MSAPVTDHLGRDDKDFAIEFGEYLAEAALLYMLAVDSGGCSQDQTEAWRRLNSAVYEFRKRANRARSADT